MFHAKVLPLLSNECEVWFAAQSCGSQNKVWAQAERAHLEFLRGILGVSTRAANEVVLGGIGRQPLYVHWAALEARFRAKLMYMPASRPP